MPHSNTKCTDSCENDFVCSFILVHLQKNETVSWTGFLQKAWHGLKTDRFPQNFLTPVELVTPQLKQVCKKMLWTEQKGESL